MLNIISKNRCLILVCSVQFMISSALFAQEAGVTKNGLTVVESLDRAERALAMDRLTTPPNDNAVAYIERALAIKPNDQRAIRLLEQVSKRYGELVVTSLKRGEQVRRNSLQRAKVFRDRAQEVVTKHGLGTTELQGMNKNIVSYNWVPDGETITETPASSVSSVLVKKLFDQHVLLTALALDHNNVHEAQWHVNQADKMADRYAFTSLRLDALKQKITSSQRQEAKKSDGEPHLVSENDAGKEQIKGLITSHVRLGRSALRRGDLSLARSHRDIAAELAAQYSISDNTLNRFAEQFAASGSSPSLQRHFRLWGTF